MVTLISDGGQMTVGRRLASHVWGQFSVTLPEGEKQKDPDDDRIVDGYVYRPDDAGRGRGELTFMRADAKLDMNASRSDLEATLDGASRRTEGDVFYSREISGLGLGRAVPGVDYTVGDVVSVLVWGRRLTLPVTAVTAVSDTSGGAPWRVQVGGQVLRDAAALRKRNDDLQSQIAVEKRQRLRQVGTVDRKATRAQGTADKAAERASELQKFLSGSDGGDLVSALDAINKQLAAQEEPAASGLVPAYLRINAQLWEAQQKIDAVQTTAIADNEAGIGELETLTDELVKTQQELVARPIPVLSDGNDGQYFSREEATVTARGEWAGDVQVLEDDVGPRAVRIPTLEGGRTISLENADSWVTLLALVSQGVMRRFVGDLSASLPSASVSWGHVDGSPSFTASMTGEHTIRAKVSWERAIYFATYGLRIVVGGKVVKTIEQSKIGPLIGNSVRSQVLTVSDVMVNAGQKVELQVKADTSEGPAKWVRSLTLDVVWVEGA